MASIVINDHKALKGLLQVAFHPHMVTLMLWVFIRLSKVVFTSTFRAKKVHEKDSGIHGTIPCRAIDISSHIYDDPQSICKDINEHFQYDPKRPEYVCAQVHDVGLGEHIHLQVHDRTVYLGG